MALHGGSGGHDAAQTRRRPALRLSGCAFRRGTFGARFSGLCADLLLSKRERQAGRRRPYLRPRQNRKPVGVCRGGPDGLLVRVVHVGSHHADGVPHRESPPLHLASAGVDYFDHCGPLALTAVARGGSAHRVAGAGDGRLPLCLGYLGHACSAGRIGRDLARICIGHCRPSLRRPVRSDPGFAADSAHGLSAWVTRPWTHFWTKSPRKLAAGWCARWSAWKACWPWSARGCGVQAPATLSISRWRCRGDSPLSTPANW